MVIVYSCNWGGGGGGGGNENVLMAWDMIVYGKVCNKSIRSPSFFVMASARVLGPCQWTPSLSEIKYKNRAWDINAMQLFTT